MGAMVTGAVALAIYNTTSMRKDLVTDLNSRAAMLAITADPTLRFNNPEDGAAVLASLKGAQNIPLAALYSANGELFATYPANHERMYYPATLPAKALARFEGGFLEVFLPIQPDRERLGWVYIKSTLDGVQQRIRTALWVQGLILAGILALVLVLVPRLQRSITEPIHHLAETAEAISASENYDLRVKVEGSVRELHTLGGSFNAMISRLQQHKEHLEAQVKERTQELIATNQDLIVAKEKAEEASKAKSAFLASMSHELRTPLNAVLGFAQVMAREPGRSPRDQGHLDKIMKAGEHLLGLINDVLSLARIEAQKLTLNPQPFDFRQVIDTVQSMIRVRTKAKGLAFDVEVDPDLPTYVMGDEGKLRQVILNLLGNSVKFTETGGVGLRIFALPEDRVRFEVEDTGPGIAAEEISKLFGTFVQTDSGKRSKEGSGLGLHLSQALVGLMEGHIEVKSELGKGSVFSFDIHLPPTEAAAVPQTEVRRSFRLEPGQKEQRHLVVDDKEDNRALLRELLESVGFVVQTADDGQAAVKAWDEWRPDVIWMDMRMPIMDGYTATRNIRKLEKERENPPTKIFAITASVFAHDRQEVLDAGCDAMIGKPFREQELFELVERHAGVRFLTEEKAPKVKPPPTVSQETIETLDSAWRKTFLEALAMGDMEKATRLTNELPESLTSLAAALKRHIEAFQMDEAERLVAPKEAS